MRICIVQPNVCTISETFLQAHYERLEDVVGLVHKERNLPVINGRTLLSQSPAQKLVRKLGRTIQRREWSWEITAAYLRAFRQLQPDVVLAEYGQSGVATMEACKIASIPFVAHFHGYDASVYDVIERHRETYPEMFSQAAAVIAVSKAMEQALIVLGCPCDKIVMSPYGIDCDRFANANPEVSEDSFLAVGRLTGKKAPHLTLLAFDKVLQEYPNARLRMIGDGDLMPLCRDITKSLQLDHAVTFLGPQNHDVVSREMQRARAFVQHSVVAASGDSEGTPVAVLEAGASGLPVVATRHAGIPDVVVDGQTGLLVDEKDVLGMADRMIRLLHDPKFAGGLGNAARRRIRERYTMRQSIDRLQRVLNAAASGREIADVRRSVELELDESPGEIEKVKL